VVGEWAAVMSTLIMTAKLNDVDPQAWMADVFARIASMLQSGLHELLPWEWKPRAEEAAPAKAA
jgi:transposase